MSQYVPRGVVGVSGAVQGTAGYRAHCWTHADWKHESFRVACTERGHCAKALRIDSSNSSFTRKSCACASIAFLAGITSRSVNSTYLLVVKVKRPLGSLNWRWKDSILTVGKETHCVSLWGYGPASPGSGKRPMADSCEYANKREVWVFSLCFHRAFSHNTNKSPTQCTILW
jgi:hypothetical protein